MTEIKKSNQPLADLTQTIGPFAKQEAVLYPDRVELRYKGLIRQWRHRVHLHQTKEKLDSVRNPITAELIVRMFLFLIATAALWFLLPFFVYYVYEFFQ